MTKLIPGKLYRCRKFNITITYVGNDQKDVWYTLDEVMMFLERSHKGYGLFLMGDKVVEADVITLYNKDESLTPHMEEVTRKD